MSNLSESLASGKFVVTSEIAPPKGVDIQKALEDALFLQGKVEAINVTDQQSSVMRLGSLALSHLLKAEGLEPIYQLTCRDRNRIALQSDLLSAHVLGIENVLCLTGDYVSLGDHPQAKPVFDLDSVSLLGTASQLQEGHDMVGNELAGSPQFFLGAAVTPGADPIELQVMRMEKKVQMGAQFFQSQAVYDIQEFERFIKAARHIQKPILAGIILLKSGGMARFMNKNIAGVHVPDSIIEEMDAAESKPKKSVEIAAQLIKELRPLCQGVHIMALGWERRIPEVLEEAGLLGQPA